MSRELTEPVRNYTLYFEVRSGDQRRYCGHQHMNETEAEKCGLRKDVVRELGKDRKVWKIEQRAIMYFGKKRAVCALCRRAR